MSEFESMANVAKSVLIKTVLDLVEDLQTQHIMRETARAQIDKLQGLMMQAMWYLEERGVIEPDVDRHSSTDSAFARAMNDLNLRLAEWEIERKKLQQLY